MRAFLRGAGLALLLVAGLVRAQSEIIVDTNGPAFSKTGTWSSVGSKSCLGGPCLSASTTSGAPTATATWAPTLPAAGTYAVYAWWDSGSTRATNATYTVNHAGGATAVVVNQQQNGDRWNLLGTFTFNAGSAGNVALNNQGNNLAVIADAIRLMPGGAPGLASIADTYTSSAQPNGNFGGQGEMRVRTGSTNYRAYLKFDLSAMPATFVSAKLRLYGDGPSGATVGVFPVANTTWDEMKITWNAQPPPGPTALSSVTIAGATPQWYEWNITAYVQTEKTAGRNTISLALLGIGSTTDHSDFKTRDASSNKPVIEIEYAVGPKLSFIHPDHLNTPRAVYDSTQQLRWRWDQQEPFGDNPADENPVNLGAFEFPLRLSNYYADKETGNLYAMYRDAYSPGIGRFSQSDPIGLVAGLNTYSYVDADPLRLRDPLGLAAMCATSESRECEAKLLAAMAACEAVEAACIGGCSLACRRSGPLRSQCMSMCVGGICEPVAGYCRKGAATDYAECKRRQGAK